MKPGSDGYKERVNNYLRERAAAQGMYLPGETASLFEAGVMDSFGLLEFVGFIEEELGIEIPDEDLLAGNFETIAKVNEYIKGRVEA